MSDRVTYAQLRAFNAVAREGSFSAAAASLGVTQPAVTAQVRALEDEFEVQLFERTANGVTMTPLAIALFGETDGLRDIEDAAIELLSASTALRAGELRIMSGAPNPATGLIALFRQRYPELRLTARFGNWDQVVSAVFNRECDIAVVTGAPKDERLCVESLVLQRIMALVPCDHPLASRRRLSLVELMDEPLILRMQESLTQKTVDAKLRELGLAPRRGLVLEGREAVYEAVCKGLGIGFMFDQASSRTEGAVRIPIKELNERYSEDVFCLASQRKRRIVAAFFEVAAGARR